MALWGALISSCCGLTGIKLPSLHTEATPHDPNGSVGCTLLSSLLWRHGDRVMNVEKVAGRPAATLEDTAGRYSASAVVVGPATVTALQVA